MSLRKELKVSTSYNAVHNWFLTKPEIFKTLPDVFQEQLLKWYNEVKLDKIIYK